MGTTGFTRGFTSAAVLGLASSVSDFISKLERDLGVDGTELTVLFCLVLGALIVLLMIGNRATKKKALRIAHAGSFAAPDPFARSFRLQRSVQFEKLPDPVTDGPARDLSNPRYRPETQLPHVPDPAFPTLEEIRIAALADGHAPRNFGTSEVPPLVMSSPFMASPVVTNPVVASPIVASPIVASPIGVAPGGSNPSGMVPSGPSSTGTNPADSDSAKRQPKR